MPITHCILGKTNSVISNTKFILSHYQALGQCKSYITKHFPNATQIVTNSTAEAAHFLQDKNNTPLIRVPDECKSSNTIIIGNKVLAEMYNLKILKLNINDIENNMTRFIIIGKKNQKISGKDKTSLIFTTENKPGALNNVLNTFANYNINLLSISSRPSKKKMGEYLFYVDINGHQLDNKLSHVLTKIEKIVNFYKVLGSFSITSIETC